MTVPERSTDRRIARLERRLAELEDVQRRTELFAKRVEPIRGRLWLFTLTEDMGATTTDEASADLSSLDDTDTSQDITVVDPLSQSSDLLSGDSGQCIEQLDVDGTRYFVALSASTSRAKLFCRFTLDAALATSDASKAATIQTQWGYGTDHSTSITVNNLETSTASTYVFEGDSGDAGIAIYSGSGSTWYIIQMECP